MVVVCLDKFYLYQIRAIFNKIFRVSQMKNSKKDLNLCHCESGKDYQQCCQPYIEHSRDAPTASALMRSRYTAFALSDEDYLRYSWHPDTCPKTIHLNVKTTWLGLKIIKTTAGNIDDIKGEVEFVARSKNNGKASRLHENSRFSRFDNRWVYIDGKTDDKIVEKSTRI